ncbi:polysaccharide biosynthesis protein [Thiofilum flexile]|uniref:polysaccharide biosynthesis protein n=1 Tax=Thiofilum flexile TaxID=125627 RepID=UPI00037A1AEB|nr:nucleoside-diphosphate sugar epimerase/dehydratase [Thiofilum flexile]
MFNPSQSIYHLFTLPRWQKRIVMVTADLLILPLAIWISFALRLSTWTPTLNDGVWLMLIAPLVAFVIFTRLGLYRSIIRFMGVKALQSVVIGVTLSTIVLWVVATFAHWKGIPQSIYPIYWGTALLVIGGSRYLMRRYYQLLNSRQHQQQRAAVLIYGAGQSGAQLAAALEHNEYYRAVAFVDDNPSLHKSLIQGLSIYAPEQTARLIEQYAIKHIFLAMPLIAHTRKRQIIQSLESLPVHVRTIPSMTELLSGQRSIDEIREIDIDELLGREAVAPNQALLSVCIQNHHVMVTGAGGSIGSELCRQILRQQPSSLVLYELSEYALYQIEQELLEINRSEGLNIPVIPVLGSVQDRQRLDETIKNNQIQTLYHAAAYKHVPLVEHNPIEGIRNNTLGTYHTAQAALAHQVKHFVLISTDKAVRPTNVMGASKRMAELVLQGISEQTQHTCFSMVRFGNVLGSSGSVVPLFRKQIQQGGPITVTHPDIIRYFMTIPEAAQLVIQAGALAQGGEVFLLDMGEPVKIVDLARRMIHLKGLSVKNETNPYGDIAIEFSGLRPGEKLYEELLIDDHAQPTQHPRIRQAHEDYLTWPQIQQVISTLQYACSQRDLLTIYQLLLQHVNGFKPTHLPDYLAPLASHTLPTSNSHTNTSPPRIPSLSFTPLSAN